MNIKRAGLICQVLIRKYCSKYNGLIMVWPSWLSSKILYTLESFGLARHEHGGPSTYAATFWFILL